MAKTSAIEKNRSRVKEVTRFKDKRAQLKKQIYNKDLPIDERYSLIQKLNDLPRDSAATRIRRRCELTGRPRGVYRKFLLCRNMLRQLAGQGQIPGLCKSSW